MAKNKAKVNEIIRKLGGRNMDSQININGVTFRFDTRQYSENNWFKDGLIAANGTFGGKQIAWSIGMAPPHQIRGYETHEGETHPARIDMKKPKKDLTKFVQIEVKKITLAKTLKKLGVKGETVSILGINFTIDSEDKIDEKLEKGEDLYSDGTHRGEEILWGLEPGNPIRAFHITGGPGASTTEKVYLKGSALAAIKAYVKAEKARIDKKDKKKEPKLFAAK